MSSSQAFIHRHVNEHGACSKGRWTKLEEIMKLEGRGGLRSDRSAVPAVDACGHSGCKPEEANLSEGKPGFFNFHEVLKLCYILIVKPWSGAEVICFYSLCLLYLQKSSKLWRKGCKNECKGSWLPPELLIYHHL